MYVLFCAVVGLMVFRWFNRHAPDYTTAPEPGQTAPTKEQTWIRRKGTLGGLLAIALGLASAIVMYLTDMASFDYLTKCMRWSLRSCMPSFGASPAGS